MHDLAAQYLNPGDVILDAGCRDAEHLIRLVERHSCRGVGVDPVEIHIARGEAAVAEAGLAGRIVFHHGVIQDLPWPDSHFNLIWCRDVLEQVDDLEGALTELVRVTKPGAPLIVFTVFATKSFDAGDDELMRHHLGYVEGSLDRVRMEDQFAAAGLRVERVEEISTEWREYSEERTQPVSRALLRLARLRKSRDEIVDNHGQEIFDHIEANLHWEVFQFLGKLEPVVYVLRS